MPLAAFGLALGLALRAADFLTDGRDFFARDLAIADRCVGLGQDYLHSDYLHCDGVSDQSELMNEMMDRIETDQADENKVDRDDVV